MAPAGPWADLNGELLESIAAADGVSLRDYRCLRGVCAAWRSALKPPYPCLLSLADGKDWHWRSAWPSASVLSLPTQRSSILQTPDDLTVVALYDRKNVAYIDITTGSSRKWTSIDVLPSSPEYYELVLKDLAFDNDGKLYCLDSCGGAYMVSIPSGSRNCHVVVEPIVCNPNPLAAFAPPYDRASELTDTKHLFFCDGGMYQMWRNKSVAVTLRDTRFRMAADEIFVFRYNPPCWEAVRDLGGCSVFIGKNNPVVVRPAAAGQPWVRPNCVYWIDWKRVPMVCDIATGTSNPCVLPDGACKGNCWYFDNDIEGHI